MKDFGITKGQMRKIMAMEEDGLLDCDSFEVLLEKGRNMSLLAKRERLIQAARRNVEKDMPKDDPLPELTLLERRVNIWRLTDDHSDFVPAIELAATLLGNAEQANGWTDSFPFKKGLSLFRRFVECVMYLPRMGEEMQRFVETRTVFWRVAYRLSLLKQKICITTPAFFDVLIHDTQKVADDRIEYRKIGVEDDEIDALLEETILALIKFNVDISVAHELAIRILDPVRRAKMLVAVANAEKDTTLPSDPFEYKDILKIDIDPARWLTFLLDTLEQHSDPSQLDLSKCTDVLEEIGTETVEALQSTISLGVRLLKLAHLTQKIEAEDGVLEILRPHIHKITEPKLLGEFAKILKDMGASVFGFDNLMQRMHNDPSCWASEAEVLCHIAKRTNGWEGLEEAESVILRDGVQDRDRVRLFVSLALSTRRLTQINYAMEALKRCKNPTEECLYVVGAIDWLLSVVGR